MLLPSSIGPRKLQKEELRADKKTCVRIGPVGMGKKALYLNSFYLSRRYYAPWPYVRRVYKEVAMSKGGFTGIGAFGAMAYLVAEFTDGTSKRCNFKFEQNVDEALAWIEKNHPEIPVRSVNAQRKLDEAERKEKARYLTELSEEAKGTIRSLEAAEDFLEKRPELAQALSAAAGTKRVQMRVSPGKRALGIGIFLASLAALISGVLFWIHGESWGIYLILFGVAFTLFSMSGNLVPIGRNSRKRVDGDWQNACLAMEDYIKGYQNFPLPARYAHPIVLRRMVRVIREGRAVDAETALAKVKEDLKGLNKSVTVSQKEYDEVVQVKQMFLVSDYQ